MRLPTDTPIRIARPGRRFYPRVAGCSQIGVIGSRWTGNPKIQYRYLVNPTESLANHASHGQDGQVGSRDSRNNVVLDEVSKRIIEQLQEDGRRPYAAIGKAVGLSEAAVRQRVQRLLEGGVMQIVAVTDPLTVGFPRQAMVGVRIEGDVDPVAEQLAAMVEVDYVVITAGSFDLLVEIVCENDDHLLDTVNKRIRSIPGVRGTETFVYLKLRKQTYTWGTR
jgi:Lrp/AsnC family transcriptional regulator for asnA, asnC and gidA